MNRNIFDRRHCQPAYQWELVLYSQKINYVLQDLVQVSTSVFVNNNVLDPRDMASNDSVLRVISVLPSHLLVAMSGWRDSSTVHAVLAITVFVAAGYVEPIGHGDGGGSAHKWLGTQSPKFVPSYLSS